MIVIQGLRLRVELAIGSRTSGSRPQLSRRSHPTDPSIRSNGWATCNVQVSRSSIMNIESIYNLVRSRFFVSNSDTPKFGILDVDISYK